MIYYISGGARSGKSSYAMQLALQKTDNPLYIATARRWDDDFQQRIDRHAADRDERWTLYEEEKQLSRLPLQGSVAVIDCVTLWLTNYFVDEKQEVEAALSAFKEEVNKLCELDTTLIFISNELGMGLHAQSEAGRIFTDLQGWANQYLAQQADRAIFMVSGLPLVLK